MCGIKEFYCKMCNNGIATTRKGLRDHLKTHVRNNLMNQRTNEQGRRITSVKQPWWEAKQCQVH